MATSIFGLLVLIALSCWLVFVGNRIYRAYEDGRIKDLIFWVICLLVSLR